MQRVVLLFVAILSVIRAIPFDLDSVDRPVNRYTWVEKVGSEKGRSLQGLRDLFGDLERCGDLQNAATVIPEEGCVYYAHGDVQFIDVLSAVDVKDVYAALGDAAIEECKVAVDDTISVPKDGCFNIDQGITNGVYLYGVYDDDAVQKVEYISNMFGKDIEICYDIVDEVLDQGCLMYSGKGFHLLNVLNDDNLAGVKKFLSNLDIEECKFEDEDGLISSAEPCYFIDEQHDSVHFLKFFTEDDNHGKETNEIQDTKFSTNVPASVKTTIWIDNLQKLIFKGLLNQRSPVIKTSKGVLRKKMQSRQTLQEAQKKLDAHKMAG